MRMRRGGRSCVAGEHEVAPLLTVLPLHEHVVIGVFVPQPGEGDVRAVGDDGDVARATSAVPFVTENAKRDGRTG